MASSNDESVSESNVMEADQIKLSYGHDGWQRRMRVSDLKFQWVRVDDTGGIDANNPPPTTNAAWVRQLEFPYGDDPRIIRDGILTLVPASEAVVDSSITSVDNCDLVTYSDIANAQVKSFEEKAQWFHDTCSQLHVDWHESHMRINVRRQFVLADSIEVVMSLSRNELCKWWRFEFDGELGIDSGGVSREWFHLVLEEIFDPNKGLWQSSAVNQMCMEIHPASAGKCELGMKLICQGFCIAPHTLSWPQKNLLAKVI